MRKIIKVLGSDISIVCRSGNLRVVNPNGIRFNQIENVISALRSASSASYSLNEAQKKVAK